MDVNLVVATVLRLWIDPLASSALLWVRAQSPKSGLLMPWGLTRVTWLLLTVVNLDLVARGSEKHSV